MIMGNTEDKRVETLVSLSNACWTEYNERRTYEWKVSFGLWTALGIISGFALKEDIAIPIDSCLLTFLLLSILCVYFLFHWGLHKSNMHDQYKRHIYNAFIHQEIGIKKGELDKDFIIENFKSIGINTEIPEKIIDENKNVFKVESKKNNWWLLRTWSHGSQIFITALLLFIMWFLITNKEVPRSSCKCKQSIECKK